MTVYIDENMPMIFAEGFQKLQAPLIKKLSIPFPVNVKSIQNEFGKGTNDDVWIPIIGGRDACVVTKDTHLKSRKHEIELLREHQINMIYLKAPKRAEFTYWEMVELLVKNWPQVLNIISTHSRPFVIILNKGSVTPKIES
jgi:hypothetical protein